MNSSFASIGHVSTVKNDKCATEFTLWHNHLGHAPLHTLKYIKYVPHLFVKPHEHVRVTCPMAKFTKLPFHSSTSFITSPFKLIYMDIWGPYRVPTRGNYRFFLTIVDDYSRATCVYLLTYKSQSLDTLKTFMSYVQNHFISPSNTFAQIMPLNLTVSLVDSFLSHRVPYIKHLAMIGHNKMVWLSANIDTYLKSLEHFVFKLAFLSLFWGTVFWLQFIS